MKITGLALQGVGPYEDKAIFKIQPGISVIYGLNRTSGKKSKNSNWVGKSLLFSTISEVLYEQPIVGSKQDRITKGLQQIILQDDKDKYLISKKNNKYIIKKNGEDLDFVTNKKGPKEFLESIWSLTLEEYETFVHIDSRVPHPLVMGSTAVRKDFFTKFFGLDKVDAERKIYLAELSKLDSVKESYNTLLSTYKLIKKDAILGNELEDLESKVNKLKEKQASMKKSMLEMQERQRLVDLASSLKDELAQLQKDSCFTEQSILDKRDSLEAQLKQLSKKKDLAKKYQLYKITAKAYEDAYSTLNDFEKSVSLEKAEEGYLRYNRCKDRLDSINSYISNIEEKIVNYSDKEPKDPKIDSGKLLDDLSIIKHQINHARIFETGTCPTCGQSVKVDIDELQKKYDDLLKQKEILDKYKQDKIAYDTYVSLRDNLKSLKEEKEEYSAKLEKYKKYVSIYKKLSALPEKPEEFEDPIYNLEDINNQYDALSSKYSFYKRMSTFASRLEQYFALEDKTVDTSIFETYNSLSNKYFELKTKLESAYSTKEKLSKIESQLTDMRTQLKDVKPLEYLVELFQDKTLKKRIIQIIGNRLMQIVNKYAAVVFNEDYKFSLEWESSQINLLCTRKAGKSVLTSDVRKLSGAESRLFTLILILALLSFVPSNKRPNLLLLDEPDSAMSNETAEAFYKIIKVLSSAIESIVIITVKDNTYPDTRCYTIVREGTSKIIEGHPDEL